MINCYNRVSRLSDTRNSDGSVNETILNIGEIGEYNEKNREFFGRQSGRAKQFFYQPVTRRIKV